MKTFFLWFIGLPVALYLAALLIGVSMSLYNARQNSPMFDPVTFDLSDYKPDGTSEKKPDYIFYVPARYWGGFSLGYKERNFYFVFKFDLEDLDNPNPGFRKDSVFMVVRKSVNGTLMSNVYLQELREKKPARIDGKIKTYVDEIDKKFLTQTTHFAFRGFDGEDVIAKVNLRLPGSPVDGYLGMTIVRKIHPDIEIDYSLKNRSPFELYAADQKVTTYIKSLQVPPASFTRLK